MNQVIKIFLLLAIVCLLNNNLRSQSVADSSSNLKGKAVKWAAVSGKNNEFIFYIPEGYETTSDGNYYKGGKIGEGAHVDRELKVARYINGVVLILEYYEGEAKQIQKTLEEHERLVPIKTEEINGFQVKRFSENKDKQYFKTQHFQIKNRLYVAKTVSFLENNEITRSFFESIRLVNKNNSVAPNAPEDATSTTLPDLIEQEPQRLDDLNAVTEKDVDRKVIILKILRPKFPMDTIRNLSSGRLKLKILYSSSGKITNVEVLESPSKQLEKAAIESARNTNFIPAEKDGKLVSVVKTQEYSFGTTTEIRRF